MTSIRPVDMVVLNTLFESSPGYVLNFSDRTFTQFFAGELNVDIDDPIYSREGTSKGKRLRCFLKTVDKDTAVRTLKALWEYREAVRMQYGNEETVQNAQGQFLALIDRVNGIVSLKSSAHSRI